jgi:hypothetical protein
LGSTSIRAFPVDGLEPLLAQLLHVAALVLETTLLQEDK